MTTRECFELIGADYEDAVDRLLTDDRVKKYTLKFLEETSFESIKREMEAGNYDEAFKHAHNFKGICQNLSFEGLYRYAYELTEALRDTTRDVGKAENLLADVGRAYDKTIEAIKRLKEE